MVTPKSLTGFILLLFFLFSACGNGKSNSGNTTSPPAVSENKTVIENGEEYIITKSGKKIPKAEKGITIVSETGWSAKDMEFHLQYCQEMLQGNTDVDALAFCKCFLEKIQYYYQPIYLREAYDDQIKWNAACIEAAQK